MNKAKRHFKIREVIANHDIETQDELVERLQNAGYNVTQATISRDIKELQLVKVPTLRGEYKYSLPADRKFNPLEKLNRLLTDSFVSINQADNLLVVKTMPGNAMAVASLIDHLDWEEIVGTIGGDDTILVISRDEATASWISERFLEMLS